jgi:hypothetical protein
LLAAEDVGVAGASARRPAVNRELNRQGRVELDVVRNLRRSDAEDLADGFAGQDATPAHSGIGFAVREDHVERNLVDASVLAADRLGDFRQFVARHQTPASAMKVGKSSSGSWTRIVWFNVQR